MVYKVGATLATEEISYWEPQLPITHWMWIDPDPDTGLPPAWSDPRYAYCARVGAMPVLGTECEGDTARLTALRAHLITMPAWIGRVWVVDRPEPEDQVDTFTYAAEFAAFYDAIGTLPLAVRSRVEAGPMLKTASATYDPGYGDFLAVAALADPNNAGTVATTYPDPVTFLAGLKGYQNQGGTAYGFATGVDHFIGFDASISQSTAFAYPDPQSLLMTVTGSPTQSYTRPANPVEIEVGHEYTATMWVYVPIARTVIAALDWSDELGNWIGGEYPSFAVPAATWTEITVTGTAPAGAVYGNTGPTLPSNPATGSQLYLNAMRFRATDSAGDLRPRLILKLGAIGLPADTDGTGRAAWLQGIADELDTWDPDVQGWVFGGLIWHNVEGEPGADLTGAGPRRWYQLDRRTNASESWDLIAGSPPPPVATFNAIAAANADAAVPAPVSPGSAGLPIDGPAAARLMHAEYTILVTDANLNVLGDPIDGWSSLQATLRWKEPGSGQIVVPAQQYIREQLVPGCRIVVLRRVLGQQHILLAGPLESKLRERADDGEKGGVGTYTITFADDMAWLAARLAWPNPALLPENQTTDFWVYTGNPEQAMLTLVDTQAGPGALAARRVPKLVAASFSGVAGAGTIKLGATTDVAPRERLETLTDVLRRICTLGVGDTGIYHPDSLGFRVRQTQINGADVILFEPVRANDLSGEVHFSMGRGNLKYYSYEEKSPSLTHPIVGGQGDGADRYIKEFPTTDSTQLSWGRYEGYVARPGTTPAAEMQAAATEALAETRANGRLASNAADTIDCRFGIHYNVGDLVSVELDIGEWVIAPVQTVNLQAWPTAGEVVGTTIGDQAARYDSAWINQMRAIDRRLGSLERRARTTV